MPTEMELTLEQTQQGVSYEVSVLSDIEDSHGPSDAMHKPLPATQSQKDFVSKLTEIHSFLLTFSLRNIRVNSFTMKMEILLEPTSNKLMVEHAEYDESNTYVLERFNTTAGNPVKKILLKLNLSDHRLFKDGGGDFRYSDTTHLSQSVEVLKLKNFKKDATLKLSKSTNQERQGHYRSDCPKLKDQNHGNKAGNKNGVGEVRGKAYVLGKGEVNPDSNVVKGCETVNECQRCLELKTELLNKKDFVDKETYEKLVRLSTSASGSQPSGNTRNDRIRKHQLMDPGLLQNSMKENKMILIMSVLTVVPKSSSGIWIPVAR
ncbi:hypothetical protein Tco_1400282 [Tanacetum coccineum]